MAGPDPSPDDLPHDDLAAFELGDDGLLARLSGWLLLVFGGVLVFAGIRYREWTDIAPPLVVLGALTVVLALLLARAEGPIKLSPTGGLEMVLQQARRRAKKDKGLSQPRRDELIAAVLEQAVQSPELLDSNGHARALADSLYFGARREGLQLETRLRAELRSEGWQIQPGPRRNGPDIIAMRGQERLLAEVKATQQVLTEGRLMQWVAEMYKRYGSKDPGARLLLFIGAPAYTDKAIELINSSPGLEIRLATERETVASTREG